MLAVLLLTPACEARDTSAPAGNGTAPAVIPEMPDPRAAGAPVPEAERPVHPCLVQDGERLHVAPIRAIGTEPFWGARTQGRCVTYSTPEDQAGTRVWAKFELGPNGSVWTGALRGKRFQLSVRPLLGCSDGMSDTRYPLEARVLVDGEERRGCAESLATGR